jgi:formate hydrogenlyase subunit 6/NADH:ubiquinone oxidoreductase subunit I
VPPSQIDNHATIERHYFQRLLDSLVERGYRLVGPTIRDGAIVYDQLRAVTDLPIGWTDEQDGGVYRLKKRDDQAIFGYVVGPHSWKKFLLAPELRLWQARRGENGFEIVETTSEIPKLAFIGIRSCELHAIAIQDKVFLHGPYVDPSYALRRKDVFTVAVNCGQAGGTCFCASMNTGPKATKGYDLALTEILDNDRHYFVAEAASDLGREVLADVRHRTANEQEVATADRIVANTAQKMGRQLDTTDIKELFYRNYENSRWDDVARRCLTCANCTMVCPTCFCTTVEDTTDLTGQNAERWRKWDSCFTMDFSYIHGGSVRSSTASRYRQWITHKLATWFDQFGSSGCVGCGRCITWCPVAIDITEETRAIRDSENSGKGKRNGDA